MNILQTVKGIFLLKKVVVEMSGLGVLCVNLQSHVADFSLTNFINYYALLIALTVQKYTKLRIK